MRIRRQPLFLKGYVVYPKRALSENQVIYHRGERGGRRVLRPFSTLRVPLRYMGSCGDCVFSGGGKTTRFHEIDTEILWKSV